MNREQKKLPGCAGELCCQNRPLLNALHHDAAVHFAAFRRAVVSNRIGFALTNGFEAAGIHAVLDEFGADCIGAFLGKLQVGAFLAAVVRVTKNLITFVLAFFLVQVFGHFTESSLRVGGEFRLAAGKEHFELDFFNGASFGSRIAGFERTLVETGALSGEDVEHTLLGHPRIANAVSVGVRIVERAAVVLDSAGIKRALVEAGALSDEHVEHTLLSHPRIANAIAVGVRIVERAAVVLDGTGVIRALVEARADILEDVEHALLGHPRIAHAVVVHIRIFCRAAACRERSLFVRAFVNAGANALVVVEHSLFRDPSIAHAVLVCIRIAERAAIVFNGSVFSGALVDALALLDVRIGRIFEEVAETLFGDPSIAKAIAVHVRIGPGAALVRHRTVFARAHIVAAADSGEVAQTSFVCHPRRAQGVVVRIRIFARAAVEGQLTLLVRAFVNALANAGELVEHVLLGDPRVANTIAVHVRIVKRASVCAGTLFVRALVDAFANISKFRAQAFFGNPRVANAVFIQVRIWPRAAVVAGISRFVRAVVAVVGNAVAVAVRIDEEAGPGDAAESVCGRSRAGFVSPAAFAVSTVDSVGVFLRNGEVSAHLQVDVVSDVEHETDRSFVHRKVFDRFVVAIGNVHVVFAEDGDNGQRVNFKSRRKRIESRELVVSHGEPVSAVQVEQDGRRVDFAEIHRGRSDNAENGIGRAVSEALTLFYVDVVRFANPSAALFRIGRREVAAEDKCDVEQLIFGKGCAELQIGAQVAQISLLRGIRMLEFNLVVVNRQHHGHVDDFEHAERHTEVAAQTDELINAVRATCAVD